MATAEVGTPRAGNSFVLTTAAYRENAFRVLGLPVTASPLEASREVQKIAAAQKLGAATTRPAAAFSIVPGPDATAAREASRRLGDPFLRTLDEFLWFWPLAWGDKRDVGLEAIAAGRGEVAEGVWRQHAREPHARHNLAVLDHLRALDLEAAGGAISLAPDARAAQEARWRSALEQWHAFDSAANTVVWGSFKRHLTDTVGSRLPADLLGDLQSGLGLVLLSINARIAVDGLQVRSQAATLHLKLLREQAWGPQVAAAAGEAAAQPLLGRVRTLCAQQEEAEASDVYAAFAGVVTLLDQTEPVLSGLSALLPANSPSLTSVADRVASVVRQDIINFANAARQWSVVEPVLRRLARMVRGTAARDLIATDLATVVGNRVSDEAASIATSSVDDRAKIANLNALAASLRKDQRAGAIPMPALREAFDLIAVKMNDVAYACFQAKRFDVAEEALTAGEATCIDPGLKAKFVQGRAAIRTRRDAQQRSQVYAIVWIVLIALGVIGSVIKSGGNSSSASHPTAVAQNPPRLVATPVQPPNPSLAPAWPSRAGGARASTPWDVPAVPSSTDADTMEVGGLGNGQSGRVSRGDMPRLNELNRQILADREVLLGYRRQLKSIDAEMEQAEREIDSHKSVMDEMKQQADSGQDFDEALYERHREQHNAQVERYNSSRARRRPLARQHDALIDEMNAKIREHNSYIHVAN